MYLEKEESEELEDDFMLQANLDEVLKEYKDDIPDTIPTVPLNELESALDEFIAENKKMFEPEKKIFMDFERIPFEQDHVLQNVLDKEISPARTPVESESSDELDDVVSHASQYTNTDNRPALISLGKPKEKKQKKEPKTVEEKVKESGKRERNETKEEKKIRKEKIKVEKKMIREKKKELKELQKIEKIKTDNRLVGTYDIRQGTSVIKLS